MQQEARAAPPIGQLLIEAGLIGETDLARALAFRQRIMVGWEASSSGSVPCRRNG